MRLRSLRFLPLAGLLLFVAPPTVLAGAGGTGDIVSVLPLRQTIERHGDRATMVVMFRYRRMKTGYVTNKENARPFYYNSAKATMEFDCQRKKSRIIATAFFSDRSGLGNVVHQQDATGAWADVQDRRSQESPMAIACDVAVVQQQ